MDRGQDVDIRRMLEEERRKRMQEAGTPDYRGAMDFTALSNRTGDMSGALPRLPIAGGSAGVAAAPGSGAPVDDKLAGRDDNLPRGRITEKEAAAAEQTLLKYKAGKARLENRLIQAEQWWKQRQWDYMRAHGAPGYTSYSSGWLFNVIVNKHADGIQNYPQPDILPREEGDKDEAKTLSDVIPCILEQNNFMETYSAELWQKFKGGTGIWGVYWDKNRAHGLGDVVIRNMDPLAMYWEPGITDIQDSKHVFVAELEDEEALKEEYPQLRGKSLDSSLKPSEYQHEDSVPTDGKAVVVYWYYKKSAGPGRTVLHMAKFVGHEVLFATENEPEFAKRGLYDHGLYPFVFDVLFPIEDSPAGMGYIDVGKSAQEQIDLLNEGIVTNALLGSHPRFFVRQDGNVNEEEFMDWRKPLVHVTGNLGEDSIREISTPPFSATYVTIMQNKIAELKEVCANTDVTQGISPSNMPASAIAALQEAGGKVSRTATLASYRAYCRMINLVIELIRQFYDAPRTYRITGQMGETRFVQYDNRNLQPQDGREPVFDIKVVAQQANQYTQNGQNELAMQLYTTGVFNPQNVDQALMLLETMDFAGKDEIIQRVSAQGGMYQQLIKWQQMALSLAEQFAPDMAEGLAREIMGTAGAPVAQGGGMAGMDAEQQEAVGSGPEGEAKFMQRARQRSLGTTQLQQEARK